MLNLEDNDTVKGPADIPQENIIFPPHGSLIQDRSIVPFGDSSNDS